MKSQNKSLTRTLTAAALTFAFATSSASAQVQEAQPAAAPAAAAEVVPDNQISYNVAVVSDYRYRGISQTRLQPAVQGGIDYVNNPTGVYVGAWATNIKWIKDGGGDASYEFDLYAGKRGQLNETFGYDVGALYYAYPSNGLSTNANTFELYAQISAGPFSVKYSHSTSNLFGTPDSKNSGYLDGQFNYDVYDGYVLNLHAGHQNVKNNGPVSYSDYKVGVTKDFGVFSVGIAGVKTNTDAYVGRNGKNLGKSGAVVTISKTF